MSDNVIQTSFASGELSPSMFARVDLVKYRQGAATMRNFFVDYRSGASTRPGMRFINFAKNSSLPVRMISFQVSSSQTFAIEFGDHYCRFYTNGAAVLEPTVGITSISNALPCVLNIPGNTFSAGDTIFVTGLTGMPQLSERYVTVLSVAGALVTIGDQNGNSINSAAYGVYTGGGTAARVYTITSPYAATDLALLKFVQQQNIMTLVHVAYDIYTLTASATTNWVFTKVQIGPTIGSPQNLTLSTSAAGTTNYSYQVTAVDAQNQESPPGTPTNINNAVNVAATAGTITLKWDPVTDAISYNCYKSQITFTGTVPAGQEYGFIGSSNAPTFIDSNIQADFSQTPPIIKRPFDAGSVNIVNITAGGTGYTQATVGYSVTTATGTGLVIQPVVNNTTGAVVGGVILDPGKGYAATDTITFTDSGGGSGATAVIKVQPMNHPGCVCFFQQRIYYAGSVNFPTTFWASQPGTYTNFNTSDPIIDSDAFNGTLVSLQVNAIKSMLPMPGGLILLTSQGAWQLSSGSGVASTSAVTPSNATATPQAYNGASDVPPIVINYDILYVQSKGTMVRDLSYNIYANIYTGSDISVLSNHLFFNKKITEWAYCEEPFKIVWSVREDGIMLSLTYVKEQEIFGWARHDTLGLFKSVCSVREGNNDALYAAVARQINGQWLTSIERLADRQFVYGAEDAICLDASLSSTLPTPAAGLTATTSTGSVTFTADAAVFNSGMVGSILRMDGGIATITTFNSATSLTGTWTQNPTLIIQNDPNNTPQPAAAGTWSITKPFTTFYGLDYLNGQTVGILADGGVVAPQVVTNGSITLPHPCTKVCVGLQYTAQLQTMYLDLGQEVNTIQGKRKRINSMTVRAADTRGLFIGRTLNTLVPMKEFNRNVPLGQPIPLITKDEYTNVDSLWDVQGQVWMVQNLPLPATVLGVVPEITVGDTGSRG